MVYRNNVILHNSSYSVFLCIFQQKWSFPEIRLKSTNFEFKIGFLPLIRFAHVIFSLFGQISGSVSKILLWFAWAILGMLSSSSFELTRTKTNPIAQLEHDQKSDRINSSYSKLTYLGFASIFFPKSTLRPIN